MHRATSDRSKLDVQILCRMDEEDHKLITPCRRGKKVNIGDVVFLYESYSRIHAVLLEKNKIFSSKAGNFRHEIIAGRSFGDKVYNQHGGWIVILSPSPSIFTLCIKHETQIIYNTDISIILMLLNAEPGKKIIEAGTGSCNLTCSLSSAVSPNGKVYSFEFHKERYMKAMCNVQKYKFQPVVELFLRDVVSEGFFSNNDDILGQIDAVFFDIPNPWKALNYAHQCMKEGGRIVTFSPCIEQVQKTVETLINLNYYPSEIKTYEVISKPWNIKLMKTDKVKNSVDIAELDKLPADLSFFTYSAPTRSHTGYITAATKSLMDEEFYK